MLTANITEASRARPQRNSRESDSNTNEPKRKRKHANEVTDCGRKSIFVWNLIVCTLDLYNTYATLETYVQEATVRSPRLWTHVSRFSSSTRNVWAVYCLDKVLKIIVYDVCLLIL